MKRVRPIHALISIFLTVLSAVMLYPVVWMILTSFKSNAEIRVNRTGFWPEVWTLEGYRSAFEYAPIGRWFLNSVFVTVVLTLIVILTGTLIGYVFARYEFRGKKLLFLLLLATMMIPGQVTMIPRYLMVQKLHLFDTLGALIIPHLVGPFSVFLSRQFISEIPTDLFDAARIDGSGPLGVYWHVVLPNIRPAIGAMGIFSAMGTWNDYLNPLIMLNSKEWMTLPLGLVIFDTGRQQDLSATMAVAAIIIVPMIVILLIFQKYLIKGITMSGMK